MFFSRKASSSVTKQAPLASPTETRRARDLALAGMRSSGSGSTLGLLHAANRITSAQLAAGRKWAETVSNYSAACRSPSVPRTAQLDAAGGGSIDSIRGDHEAQRHTRATAAFIAGHLALRGAGAAAEAAVVAIIEHDRAPASDAELEALRRGLQALANSRRKPR